MLIYSCGNQDMQMYLLTIDQHLHIFDDLYLHCVGTDRFLSISLDVTLLSVQECTRTFPMHTHSSYRMSILDQTNRKKPYAGHIPSTKCEENHVYLVNILFLRADDNIISFIVVEHKASWILFISRVHLFAYSRLYCNEVVKISQSKCIWFDCKSLPRCFG